MGRSTLRLREKMAFFCAVLVTMSVASLYGQNFSDAFDRDDGPVDGWTSFQGDWMIQDEALVVTSVAAAQTAEPWLWAGDPAIVVGNDFEASLTFEFPVPSVEVGRHGGIMFCASAPERRWLLDGYTIDWLDISNNGFRLIRWDGGQFTVLETGTFGFVDPPEDWQLEVKGEQILFLAGGEVIFDFVDDTHRGGHFGVWGYGTDGQVSVDDVDIRSLSPPDLSACFSATPDSGGSPLEVQFDAGCSTGEIASYDWDFGDGTVGTGETVSHTYEFIDVYQATLTVTDADGNEQTAKTTIEVIEVTDEFTDAFDRDDGPIDGWTVFQGDWLIEDEALVATSPNGSQEGEPWVWAGDPAISTPNDFEASLTFQFVEPSAEVGRHGGIMFCASSPERRWLIDGYTIDWLDRNATGFRLIRWDAGGVNVLVPGTPEILDPPEDWELEVKGERIIFRAGGEVVFDFVDATHRGGHFGVWGYGTGGKVLVDDVDIRTPGIMPKRELFVRGDANSDGSVNLTDGIKVLNFLFLGEAAPECLDAGDFDDAGASQLTITDAIGIFNWLFLGAEDPPPPTPSVAQGYPNSDCGPDPTADDLDCRTPAETCSA